MVKTVSKTLSEAFQGTAVLTPVNAGVGLVAAPPHGTPVVFYRVHGSTVFSPAASNGAMSRVATIMPLAAAVAAM